MPQPEAPNESSPAQSSVSSRLRFIGRALAKGVFGSVILPLLAGIATFVIVVKIANAIVIVGGTVGFFGSLFGAFAGSILAAFLVRAGLQGLK